MRLILFVLFITSLHPCTDFAVQSKDGAWINGRSLEFALDLQSDVRLFPRHQKMRSLNPKGGAGLEWYSKYAYLGVTALGMNFSFDGVNEEGLSFGYLWLPGVTEYPIVAPSDMKIALDFTDFGAWVMGNFSTVAEVKKALKGVRIWGHAVPQLGVPPVHAAIHDAKGNHIVVEFVGGEMQIYDNPIGTLTNSPPFDWQMKNLQNYLHLSAENADPVNQRGLILAPPGQGSGMLGLPGDFTPPSRFVKIASYLRFVTQPNQATDAVNLAEHLLNTVDIPIGTVKEKGKSSGDYTQWVVIKDLSNRIFYFRSYRDLCLKMIDLKQLKLDTTLNQSLSLFTSNGYIDLTDSFMIHEKK